MSLLERDLAVPVEWSAGLTPLQAIRAALLTTLKGDAVLVALVGAAERILYRPLRVPAVFPALTFFDFGTQPDAQVPLLDRVVQMDIWAKSLDTAEGIAKRVIDLVDFRAARRAGLPPLRLPGGQARVEHLALRADRDEAAGDGDTARKILEFRLMAYALT